MEDALTVGLPSVRGRAVSDTVANGRSAGERRVADASRVVERRDIGRTFWDTLMLASDFWDLAVKRRSALATRPGSGGAS
jgi:hypothetical protein